MTYKVNEYDQTVNKPKSMSSLMDKFKVGREVTKHNYEFQEVCSDLAPIYGKAIWSLPHKKGITEHKIKEAHEIAKKRGIITYGYLLGIIKRL